MAAEEVDVGITAYVTTCAGFSAILKHRYSLRTYQAP